MTRNTNATHSRLHRLARHSLTAASVAFIAMTLSGCESKTPTASNTPPPAAKTPATPPPGATAAIPGMNLQLPDVKIPAQEEIDAMVNAQISDANADSAFADLQKDIDNDTGG